MKSQVIIITLFLCASIALAQPVVSITPLLVAPGSILTISVSGQPGERCAIEVRGPTGTLEFVKEVTLATDGKGSVPWLVPEAAVYGVYTVYVSCTISGAAPPTVFRVTMVVGGEARKDHSPFLITIITASALMLVAVGLIRKTRE